MPRKGDVAITPPSSQITASIIRSPPRPRAAPPSGARGRYGLRRGQHDGEVAPGVGIGQGEGVIGRHREGDGGVAGRVVAVDGGHLARRATTYAAGAASVTAITSTRSPARTRTLAPATSPHEAPVGRQHAGQARPPGRRQVAFGDDGPGEHRHRHHPAHRGADRPHGPVARQVLGDGGQGQIRGPDASVP